MPKLGEVFRHIRSKNAGPFWVTVDLFFDGEAQFRRYRDTPALDAHVFAQLFGTDAALVKRIPVDNLHVIKISYARSHPQGWMQERDMHSGQQFAQLLELEVG